MCECVPGMEQQMLHPDQYGVLAGSSRRGIANVHRFSACALDAPHPMQSVDLFDAAAFSISDAEAVLMDPQQRMLLECVGEALLAGGGRILQARRVPLASGEGGVLA